MTNPDDPELPEVELTRLQLIGSDTDTGLCTDESCGLPDGNA